jgi:hypothetical protein
MNPKLTPILERIIARETILQSFHADNLPQSALAYVRHNYVMNSFLSDEEQDLIETLPPFADNLSESICPGGGIGNPDSPVFHLFDDGSLWSTTNAYQQIWSDARDYAVETILPLMRLSRMDAELLRAIGMEDAVESIRGDFFYGFAEEIRLANIHIYDARERWGIYSRQLGDGEREKAELGGLESGKREGQLFVESFKLEIITA